MYSEKLAFAVKHNGRVLREHGDTVHLPFGSEYSLLIKNKNSLRALVRVEIDGTDVTGGVQLIVPANGSIDLERFIENGNFDRGHKFKFIERTKKIEDGPRGIQVEDGLIRVEFEFERQAPKVEYETIKRTYIDDYWTRHRWYPYWNGPYYGTLTSTAGSGELLCSANSAAAKGVADDLSEARAYATSASFSASGDGMASVTSDSFAIPQNAAAESVFLNQASQTVNDVGITVKGSESDQKFEAGAWFATDGQKHVMVMKLLGRVGEAPVEQPITVKTKVECPTCGTLNKHGTKFCGECGTSLVKL